jgi:hypothetical protein
VEAMMTTTATISVEARPVSDGAMSDYAGHTESKEYDHHDNDTPMSFEGVRSKGTLLFNQRACLAPMST